MKVFFDTSVLLAALVREHPRHDRLGDPGLSGGIIYDALACRAAIRAKAEILLTFNVKDFHRACPEVASRIEEP